MESQSIESNFKYTEIRVVTFYVLL